jgi:hypothetical protein
MQKGVIQAKQKLSIIKATAETENNNLVIRELEAEKNNIRKVYFLREKNNRFRSIR